jgi:hypothetical protein
MIKSAKAQNTNKIETVEFHSRLLEIMRISIYVYCLSISRSVRQFWSAGFVEC